MIELLPFEEALHRVKKGAKIARINWNGKNMWVALQDPEESAKMTMPYLYMKTANNELVPWLASQTDLLASDWIILE